MEHPYALMIIYLLLLCLILLLPHKVATSSVGVECHLKEKLTLLQLKNTILLPNNSNQNIYCAADMDASISPPKSASWDDADVDCCSWDGVTCDQTLGHVIRLDLGCNPQNPSSSVQLHDDRNGNGTNMAPSAGSDMEGRNLSFFHSLTELQVLIFDGLDMSGTDLSFLMDLPFSLKVLSLQSCQLQGVIPESIFHLPELQFLDLSQNHYLSGHLPNLNWINPNLKFMDLSSTGFFGELPDSIGRLESLEILWLGNCNFSGLIPFSVGNLSRLHSIDLSLNQFSGRIPYSLSNLHQLNYLSLSSNDLIGHIPVMFINMTQLDSLDLSNNNLIGNNLMLSLLLSMPSLQILDLSGNQISGTIDEFKAAKLKLRRINLSRNRFQGQIPASMFKLVNLTELRISSNNLTGINDLELLSRLETLRVLDLSHNLLSESNIGNVELAIPNLRWLRLSWNNLSEFPSFLKSSSMDLYWLDLSGNIIGGQVPIWMWEMGKDSLLYLNLSYNSLESFEQIPWQNLMYLDLSSNMIQGEIPLSPAANAQTLMGLFISDNKLSGEIPYSICNQQSMQYLVLSKNNLSGKIPQCLGNFSMNLQVLDLKENRLLGTISLLSFEEKNSLRSLHLGSNQLQGLLPRSLINCKQLQVLDLGNNNLRDKFPSWLEMLPSLKILALHSNRLYGTIIDSNATESSFQQLRILDLSNNEFSGHFPIRYLKSMKAMVLRDKDDDLKLHYMGQGYYHDSITLTMKGSGFSMERILTILTVIDFSSNKFDGIIPVEVIAELVSLKGLNLSHNSLDGHIPISLRNLVELEWLDLSSNKLIGEIPLDLTQLTSLEELNLSHNKLVGPIPQGYQFNTFQEDSYSGNLGLCGFPLSRQCDDGHGSLHELPRSGNGGGDNSNDLKELQRKVVLMGYGCGTVVGFVVGIVAIRHRFMAKLMQYVRPTTQTLVIGWSRWTEGYP